MFVVSSNSAAKAPNNHAMNKADRSSAPARALPLVPHARIAGGRGLSARHFATAAGKGS